jgi:hypothetical protein
MKSLRFLTWPISFMLWLIGIVINPIFFVPFILGASYGYFYSDSLPGAETVSAEPNVNFDDKDTNPVRKELADRAKAAAEDQKKDKKKLAKSGVLAQTQSSGTNNTNIAVPWGEDVLKDKPAPISGSVSRIGARDWSMKLINNSEDTYSASVEVMQMARGGKRLKSDHYSYTLKPGDKIERKFTTNQSVTDCSLNLTKWKNLSGGKKKKAELTPGVTESETTTSDNAPLEQK